MRHLPPLHRSARVSGPEPVRLSPNAVQTVRAGQSTAAKKISWPPPGLGVACTCHLLPFHRSARVLTRVWLPTAVHAEAEVQATPLRPAFGPAGAGLKVGTICHVRPFHRSASVPSDWPVAGSNSLPTAMQDDRDVQATLFRSLTPRPGGLGVGWMLQVWPSHRSARVPVGLPGGVRRPPTAVHADGELHDTESRNHPPPGGSGVGRMRQVWPFHCSASVLVAGPENGFPCPPTARQDHRDRHETPIRLPPSAGLGVGWMVQVWPFHRCAEVSEVPRLLLVFPTATHAEVDTQAAAFRLPAAAPGGLDTRWMLQVLPFHRSASVAGDWLLNRLGLESPTARHPVAEVHATLYSWPIMPPAGGGMGWTAQLVPFQRSARVWKAPEESR